VKSSKLHKRQVIDNDDICSPRIISNICKFEIPNTNDLIIDDIDNSFDIIE